MSTAMEIGRDGAKSSSEPRPAPLTCLMASTMVTVLPVPGGPKMR